VLQWSCQAKHIIYNYQAYVTVISELQITTHAHKPAEAAVSSGKRQGHKTAFPANIEGVFSWEHPRQPADQATILNPVN
jgi:hypothetical protein